MGTHYGQGLRQFISSFGMNEKWAIHTFEANPVTYDIFVNQHHHLTPWVIHHNKAISNRDGEVVINIETPPGEGDTGMGSSIIDMSKWNPWGLADQDKDHFNKKSTIPCMDISEFIKRNFSKEDRIIVKMDIEGSEFEVIERMLQENTMEWIDEIYVEWHSRFFRDAAAMKLREEALKLKISKVSKLGDWK